MKIIKRLKLTNLVSDQLKDEKLSRLLGGGNSCQADGCGGDVSVNVNKTLAVMRKNNGGATHAPM